MTIRKFTIITGAVLVIGFILAMNCEMAKYRMDELSLNLDTISKKENDRKFIGLISRYLIIMKRISRGEDFEDEYIKESKLQGLLPSMYEQSSGPEISEGFNPGRSAAKIYLRGIRYIIGKDMPEQIYMDYHDPLLELAYFYLRYRKYSKALEVIDSIKKRRKNLPEYSRKILLLYSGFCNALLSEYKPAKDSYLEVIYNYPGSEEADTARMLLGFLEAINENVKTLMAKEAPLDSKAEKLYLLSSYNKAKVLYDKFIEDHAKDLNKLNRAKFYRARSVEELGERQMAVAYYMDIISRAGDSRWAKMSNKRLIILGAFYGGDDKIIQIAEENSKKLGDEKFLKSINNLKDKLIEDKFNEKTFEKKYRDFKEKEPEVNVEKEPLVTERKEKIPDVTKHDLVENFSDVIKKKITRKTPEQTGSMKKMARILSKDGFLFEGEIIHEDARVIILKTEFGKIPVKKTIIGSIERF